jgi:hypothetical protein
LTSTEGQSVQGIVPSTWKGVGHLKDHLAKFHFSTCAIWKDRFGNGLLDAVLLLFHQFDDPGWKLGKLNIRVNKTICFPVTIHGRRSDNVSTFSSNVYASTKVPR